MAAALNSDTLHTNADGSIQVVISADQNDIRLTGLDGSSDEVVVINLGNAEQEETISSTHCQVCDNFSFLEECTIQISIHFFTKKIYWIKRKDDKKQVFKFDYTLTGKYKIKTIFKDFTIALGKCMYLTWSLKKYVHVCISLSFKVNNTLKEGINFLTGLWRAVTNNIPAKGTSEEAYNRSC